MISADTQTRYSTPKVLAIAAGIVGFMVLSVTALNVKAAAAQPSGTTSPQPVETVRVLVEESYEFADLFAGTVEPRQQTEVAFERQGRVEAVTVDEGYNVAKGDILAVLDTDALEAQRDRQMADITRLKADLDLAKRTLKRQQKLFKDGNASEQRFDDARFRVSSLTAQINAATAALRGTDIDIANASIKAPFDAVIAERMVDVGAVVNAGTPVLGLLERGAVRARVGVSAAAASALEQDFPYTLSVAGRTVTANLVALRADLDANTRTRDALFDIVSDGAAPAYGEIARLEVERTVESRGFWLPATALREGRKGIWLIFTVSGADGDSAEPRIVTEAVEILYSTEDDVFVRGPVADDTRVVVRGLSKVVVGQRVKPVSAASLTAARQE